nr:hypothetical protein [Tanacetum cinerariifolium]
GRVDHLHLDSVRAGVVAVHERAGKRRADHRLSLQSRQPVVGTDRSADAAGFAALDRAFGHRHPRDRGAGISSGVLPRVSRRSLAPPAVVSGDPPVLDQLPVAGVRLENRPRL